jgi:ubiquinone/menaquinone biosynthesis C-methylase UbiE
MFGLTRHAGWYDRLPGRLARPLHRRVARDVAAAGLPAGAVVLDVGTGPGRVPLLLSQARSDLLVEGIDLSGEMIERARQTAAAEGVRSDRLHYAVADVARLPHPDGSVDLVVSSLSLHHWADVAAGLGEIRRVLKPGGTAWIYDIRWVLDRAAARARSQGLSVALERIGPRESRPLTPGALIGRTLGRLIGRLRIDG